jgi:hypothetical protein
MQVSSWGRRILGPLKMTIRRRRPRNVPHSFQDQLESRISKLQAQAAVIEPGPARDKIDAQVRELRTAEQMSEWLRAPA